jgi:hypothetical protein
MRKLFFAIVALLFPVAAYATTAPTCLYQDVLSGPVSGGEGGNGIYLNIYGTGFGASRGSSTVTVNGVAPAQYLYWGADPTGDRDQIGIQLSSSTTTGPIVVTVGGQACTGPGGTSNTLTFTVAGGNIYFIGPATDNTASVSCTSLKSGGGSYSSPWGLTNQCGTEGSCSGYPGASGSRTPYTYYSCLSSNDALIFLNGVNYPQYDGRGLHASLTVDAGNGQTHNILQARPGATVTLGNSASSGAPEYGILDAANVDAQYSGLTAIGGEGGGGGSSFQGTASSRVVGNTFECPYCSGPIGVVEAVPELVGNFVTLAASSVNPSNKTFQCIYEDFNGFEVGWNRISSVGCYNGFQVNENYSTGFYNFSVHDNDIADVNGCGINLSTVDPGSGYVQVYNNIIHHTGIQQSSDGSTDDPHCGVSMKGYAQRPQATAYSNSGTVATITTGTTDNAFSSTQSVILGGFTTATWFNCLNPTLTASSSTTITFANSHSATSGSDSGYIGQATSACITGYSVTGTSGPCTLYTATLANTLSAGQPVTIEGMSVGTFLNGTATISSRTNSQFVIPCSGHSAVGSTPDSALAIAGGTAQVWNNTLFDTSVLINTASGSENASCGFLVLDNQLEVVNNLVGNITYVPAYTYASVYNPYICTGGGPSGTITGSNNIWYSVNTPGSTSPAGSIGTIENPDFVNSTTCSPGCTWTNYQIQSGSPAIGESIQFPGPYTTYGNAALSYLTWDFQQLTRPANPAAIATGALEYSSGGGGSTNAIYDGISGMGIIIQ